jgi:hypothetical protein
MGAGAQGDLVSGIIGGVIFEQGTGGADEFMEDGDDDAHGGFADGAKAVGELLAAWVAAHGRDGGEVESGTQPRGLVADAGRFAHAGAALVETRDDPEPGGHSPGVAEMTRDLGREQSSGFLPAAPDLAEAVHIGGKIWRTLQVRLDRLFESSQLCGKPAARAPQTRPDGLAGHLQTTLLGMQRVLQIGLAPEQIAQMGLSCGQRLPPGPTIGAEATDIARDYFRIDPVGLVAPSSGAGVIEDPAGIKYEHAVTGGEGGVGKAVAVRAGRFEGDDNRGDTRLPQPGEELGVAFGGIGEMTAYGALAREQADIEGSLGDVYSEHWQR